jgi:hypothetical protein
MRHCLSARLSLLIMIRFRWDLVLGAYVNSRQVFEQHHLLLRRSQVVETGQFVLHYSYCLATILVLSRNVIRRLGVSKTKARIWTPYKKNAASCHLLTLVPRSRIFLPWRWRRSVPPKRRFTQELHGATSQKTAFFINVYILFFSLLNDNFDLCYYYYYYYYYYFVCFHVCFNVLFLQCLSVICLWLYVVFSHYVW